MIPTDIVRIDQLQHRAATEKILSLLGASKDAAIAQATMFLEGDLRGHASHGIRRLDVLVQRIRKGLADPSAQPILTWTSSAVLRVDGDKGLGPFVAEKALDELLTRVSTTGITIAAISNATHLGMLAPYVERAAERGIIGIAMTTSEALVHPWGGITSMVGTNPIAIAIPTSADPVVLDMATGEISMGKVLDYASRGIPLPEGAAIDELGLPTTDAKRALRGSISPFGGAKGYALAIVLEVLVASLTSTSLGRDIHGTLDTDYPATKGDLFILIDPSAFGNGISSAVTAYLNELRAMPPAPGHASVSIPGDRARSTRSQNLLQGVPVPKVTWEKVFQIAADLHVEI